MNLNSSKKRKLPLLKGDILLIVFLCLVIVLLFVPSFAGTDEKLTVESLAAELHLSPKHFRTLFERSVGMNPKQYITKSKLEKSQFYLTHTELSIQEIAAKLAFSSPTHYINTFTKYYHITPLLYRKDNK